MNRNIQKCQPEASRHEVCERLNAEHLSFWKGEVQLGNADGTTGVHDGIARDQQIMCHILPKAPPAHCTGLGWMAGLCLGLALFVVFGVESP